MSNVHELAPRPDQDIMRDALYALFRHAMRGMVELGWTDRTGALNRAKQFDVGDLDDIAAFATRINEIPNCNVYVSAGLRRSDIDRDQRASDEDVVSVAALKVDCDTPSCVENALKLLPAAGLAPSLAYHTGRHPHQRGSLWWVLDEPEPDLARVRRLETALALWLDSDRKVINPSRVMRLPGSVAWPFKAGRIVEMTGRIDTPLRAIPYTIDEIESALRRAGRNPEAPGDHRGAQVLDFNAAAKTLELQDLIRSAHTPHNWHQAALQSTGHLIGRGTPPEVVIDILTPLLTLPGYNHSQTREELAVMVKGALAKGWLPAAPANDPAPAIVPEGRDPFPLIALGEMGTQGPPEWRITGIIPKRGFGVLYGPSGTFKSFISLDLALSVAHGVPWRGMTVDQAPAVYIAGEGKNGIQNRVVAWTEHRKAPADAAPPKFWLAPVAADFLNPQMVRLIGDRIAAIGAKLIVVDTLARSFGAGDENKAQDMNRFVAACDYLAEVANAFVLAVHHTGVDESRERGSTVLRAAADVRLAVARSDGDMAARMHVEKQKDSEDGQRFRIRMVRVESVYPATGEVVSSLVPVTDDTAEPDLQRTTGPVRLGRNERAVMEILRAAHPLRFGQIKTQSGLDSGNLGRTLRSLFDKNLVSQSEDLWTLASVAEEV